MGKELYALSLMILFCWMGMGMLSSQSSAQNILATTSQEKRVRGNVLHADELFNRIDDVVMAKRSKTLVRQATLLELKLESVAKLLIDGNELVDLSIPFEDGNLVLELYRRSPLTSDFQARTSEGQLLQVMNGSHYRGIIQGDPESVVALSIFDGEIMAMISGRVVGNVVLGKWKDANHHVIYRESDLEISSGFSCEAPLPPGSIPKVIDRIKPQRSAAANCIKIYFEASHAIYQAKNSNVNEVLNFVSGFFNQVATIYANEGISLEMSDIYVWTSPDPYDHSSASDALDSFMAGRPSFNGDLGHLLDISGNSNGGRAYVSVLCGSFNVGYSDISPGYSGFPTYSWTVNVVAHELGHNLGSFHTQDCIWGPDNCTAIDGCAIPSPSTGCGTCDPGPIPPKGTIMSYCHLSSGNGIDFNLGFGTEPGNLIRATVSAASCLTACGSGGSGGCSLAIENLEVLDASCSSNNGQITVNTSGSTSSTTYDIGSGPQFSHVFTNLAPGDYQIIVKNGASCEQEANISIDMLSNSPELTATVTNATCGASDGMVELFAQAGSAPYSYRIGVKTQSDPIFTGLSAGEYVATVIDNVGCSNDMEITVFTESEPSLSVNIQHTSCGLENGQVELSISGGMAPFTYALANHSSNSSTFLDVSPGKYTARVLDANGCSDVQTVEVNSSNPIESEVEVTDTKCSEKNGEIHIQANGGTGKLSYSLGNDFQSNPVFTNVDAGTYTVQIADDAECVVSIPVAVASSESFLVQATIQPTTCGQANGIIDATGTTKAPGYLFQLNSGKSTSEGIFDNLRAGKYVLSVKNTEGCVVESNLDIPASTSPKIRATVGDTRCGLTNGSIEVSAEDGLAPFQYQIEDGNLRAENRFESLPPDEYRIKVIDAAGCIDTFVAIVDSSQQVHARIDVIGTKCGRNNGSVQITPNQGIAPFTYQIDSALYLDSMINSLPAGHTRVIVSDLDMCTYVDSVFIPTSEGIALLPLIEGTTCGKQNGSILIEAEGGTGQLQYQLDSLPFSNKRDFDQLDAGSYKVKVKDEVDCEEELSVEVGTSTNPELELEKLDTRCGQNNGSILLNVNKGIAPYQIIANNAPAAFGPSLQNLDPGIYEITVIDSQNCVDSGTVVIEKSTAPILEASSTPASCNQANGTIQLNATEGSTPYTFSIGYEYQSQNMFSAIDSGAYLVSVRDGEQCIDTIKIIVQYDDQFKAPFLPDESALCDGKGVSLNTEISSGINVDWSFNGTPLPTKESVLEVEMAGSYTASVKYHDGCVLEKKTFVVSRPNPIQDLPAGDTICLGDQFVIKNSNSDYNYAWSNDSVGPAVRFTKSGKYILSVANRYACTINLPLDLKVVQPVALNTSSKEVFVCSGDSANLTIQGADTYQWYLHDGSLLPLHGSDILVSPDVASQFVVIGSNSCFGDTMTISVGLHQDQFSLIDTQIIEGAPYHLFIENAVKATWGGDFQLYCKDCIDPIIRPSAPGIVWVNYVDSNACEWSDTIALDVIPLESILPRLINVITPNNDHRNDRLTFDGLDLFREVSLEVFNQDGNRLYQSKNYNNDWEGTLNGEELPEGIYFYVLQLLLDDRVFQLDSDLTIVRD